MSILASSQSKIVVQGLTGGYARIQARAMLDSGTSILAGVTPGRGGASVEGLPVYDSISEAKHIHDVDGSIIYVSAPQALDAVWEALDNGIGLVVVAAEGVPVNDTVLMRLLAEQYDAWVVGPNTVGLISPGEALIGSFPTEYALAGSIGIIARSGSLAIEVMRALSAAGLGQSTVVAVGGDPVLGSQLVDFFREFDRDEATELVVYLGEVGGMKEYDLVAELSAYHKPMVAYIAGSCAPLNTRMGHVGAIVHGHHDTASAKKAALQQAGAHVALTPWDVVDIAHNLLSGTSSTAKKYLKKNRTL